MTNSELDFIHIMDRLQKKAEEDGSVSEVEEDFLAGLRKQVEEYQQTVNEAKYDDMISEDEFHQLVVSRDQILNKAMDFETDSQDINDLVQELFDEINKHDLPGMYEDEGSGEGHTED